MQRQLALGREAPTHSSPGSRAQLGETLVLRPCAAIELDDSPTAKHNRELNCKGPCRGLHCHMIYESTWARLTQRCVDCDGDCWVGIERTRDRCGYQQVNVYVPGLRRAVKLMAHIAAWVWRAAGCTNGDDLYLAYLEVRASGLELDHKCQEPGCRNPDHLQPLTVSEHRQVTRERRYA